jgi:folate-binding protein YgfZ
MTSVSLVHRDAAAAEEIAGRQVALHFGDVVSEYATLRRGAMLVDRSHRTRMSFSGEKAADVLTGLVTNDVVALSPGHGLYAAALTPKGKIIADTRIFALPDQLLVDVPPRASEGFVAMIRKYVNPRLARYADQSTVLFDIGVVGPESRGVVARVTGIDAEALGALAPYAHIAVGVPNGDGVLVVARVPDVGVEGYELFGPVDAAPALWRDLAAAGAAPGGLAAWEIARIEAGRPEWGLDIDDGTIPQEANFDEMHAISYTKGCYTGQETVARVHFRGHVNRHLRGLRYDAPEPIPARAALTTLEGKAAGDVRSATISPRLGGIALAMVRREVAIGDRIRAGWEVGSGEVEVVSLPFES